MSIHWRIHRAPPVSNSLPQASGFFCFYTLIFRKVATLDIGALPVGSAPPSGNPESATAIDIIVKNEVLFTLNSNKLQNCFPKNQSAAG